MCLVSGVSGTWRVTTSAPVRASSGVAASSTLSWSARAWREEGIVGDHRHAEGLGALGELGADAAHAEDGEAFAIEFDALIGLAGGLEVALEALRRGPGPMLRAAASIRVKACSAVEMVLPLGVFMTTTP